MLSNIDFVTVLPFALFVACAIGVWMLAEFFLGKGNKTESRLDRLKKQATNPGAASSGDRAAGLKKLLEAASPRLSEPLKPKSEKEVGALKKKLSSAGFRSEGAVAMFSTIKALSALTGFFLAGGVSLLIKGFTIHALLYTVIVGLVCLFLPELVLTLMAKKRKEKVFLGLPDALDLMVVCVEAGLGLDQAMRKVAEELNRAHPVVGYEFKVCNQALQMGRTRNDVLKDLGERNNVDDLKTLASIMIQVDRFGTSIGQALRTQSETMRTRRKQIAEEKAAKTAVKLIFPLVLFIFPGIFVVLVGPAAITMINEMLPAFQR
jgi:tight adherence protein C